jgi:hypothetical protein
MLTFRPRLPVGFLLWLPNSDKYQIGVVGPKGISCGFIFRAPGETVFNIGSEGAIFDNIIFCEKENHSSLTKKIEVSASVAAAVSVIDGVNVTCWWRRGKKSGSKRTANIGCFPIGESLIPCC